MSLHALERHNQSNQHTLVQLREQLATTRKSQPPSAIELFEKDLPSLAAAEVVGKDIAAFAATNNLQLTEVLIEFQTGIQSEFATVLYQVNAKGDYAQIKQWVAELLGRYKTLAIKNISIQPNGRETSGQNVRATLVLYVRD